MNNLQKIDFLIDQKDYQKIINIIRNYYSYERVYYSPKMLFSSTSCYYIKDEKGLYKKTKFPFKLFIPDYILENFTQHSRQRKKIIIDFLKIFINELVIQDYIVKMNKDNFLYSYSMSNKKEKSFNLNNRKNINYFFSKFFHKEVVILENYPKKYINNNQFALGKCKIFSKNFNKGCMIGADFYSFLNRIVVEIVVNVKEIKNLKYVLELLELKNIIIILSNFDRGVMKNIDYKYNFIIEGGKCVNAFAVPNY
ncbi:hypothetical protein [Fluviispira multicolorata]|uniref:Uncharacterized protein n=1 Tax=Fluviispira multicolorata TaxID=2654512 RepID=A0A833JEH6_9BACT|nr:hypothetical protein [Fluviispira multicolorata]KAB8031909.1 hypothetical protein GCL57_04495 [Fluviispira multicolorata]